MNWENAFQCVRQISGNSEDCAQAIVLLRQEVIASSQLSAADKQDLHLALDGLQSANLYGRISLVGRLKEVLSRYAEFTVQYAEFGIRKP